MRSRSGSTTRAAGRPTPRTWGRIPVQYRFNNGVPNQITQAAYPYDWTTNVDHDMGVFVQDKWTVQRLTGTLGLRFDWFKSSSPEQHLGPTVFTPGRDITFPAQDGASLKDITPRMGAAYDLFGDGRTAVKVTLNKYLQGLSATGIAAVLNPVNRIVTTTTRSWTDAQPELCARLRPVAGRREWRVRGDGQFEFRHGESRRVIRPGDHRRLG